MYSESPMCVCNLQGNAMVPIFWVNTENKYMTTSQPAIHPSSLSPSKHQQQPVMHAKIVFCNVSQISFGLATTIRGPLPILLTLANVVTNTYTLLNRTESDFEFMLRFFRLLIYYCYFEEEEHEETCVCDIWKVTFSGRDLITSNFRKCSANESIYVHAYCMCFI